jgi:pimeloyl-ACP methyl ester carboxylesterase
MSLLSTGITNAQENVSFATRDGGLIQADLYGKGDRAVVLAHGGRFNKESWKKQAIELEKAGFRVLAIDFRGYGRSRGPGQADPSSAPIHLDVLAAVRYLREHVGPSSSLLSEAVWAETPPAMRPLSRSRVRSIAWFSSGLEEATDTLRK